jgi:hypothetical protein
MAARKLVSQHSPDAADASQDNWLIRMCCAWHPAATGADLKLKRLELMAASFQRIIASALKI